MAAPGPPGVPPAPPAPPAPLARALAPPIPTLVALVGDASCDPAGHPETMQAFACNPGNAGADVRPDAAAVFPPAVIAAPPGQGPRGRARRERNVRPQPRGRSCHTPRDGRRPPRQ